MGKLLFLSKNAKRIWESSSDEPKTGEEAFKEFEEKLIEDSKERPYDPWKQIAEQNRKNEERVKKARSEANKKIAREVRSDR